MPNDCKTAIFFCEVESRIQPPTMERVRAGNRRSAALAKITDTQGWEVWLRCWYSDGSRSDMRLVIDPGRCLARAELEAVEDWARRNHARRYGWRR